MPCGFCAMRPLLSAERKVQSAILNSFCATLYALRYMRSALSASPLSKELNSEHLNKRIQKPEVQHLPLIPVYTSLPDCYIVLNSFNKEDKFTVDARFNLQGENYKIGCSQDSYQ